MRDFLNMTKALSDESRVRVLMALRGGELCVCQVTALLGLAPSTVSKHMAVLHQARLVESRKKGRWVYYRLPPETARGDAGGLFAWMDGVLKEDAVVASDRIALAEIVRCDPQVLCAKQSGLAS